MKKKILWGKLYLLFLGSVLLLLWKPPSRPEKTENRKIEETAPKEATPQREEEEDKQFLNEISWQRMRVLLKTEDFAETVHQEVCFSAVQETVVEGSDGKRYGSEALWSFSREEQGILLNGERLLEAPAYFRLEGELCLTSLSRNSGSPVYVGTMEVWPVEEGFILVHELSLEDYLTYVLPSEMPSSFQKEALKAQAVCARTYAVKHLASYAYPKYRANVDDSVLYQVYNNTGKTEQGSEAVRETEGMILTFQGEPASAYYYSTSCGYLGNEEVWLEGDVRKTPYLKPKPEKEAGESLNLSEEAAFKEFITKEDPSCYDFESSWYRWQVEVPLEILTKNLTEALPGRYAANPKAILIEKEEGEQSLPLKSIGKLQGLEVVKRNAGGAIERLRIRGSEKTILIETEYNVRALLHASGTKLTQRDGNIVEAGRLLPSAYFSITPTWKEDGTLKGFAFFGGGYGHGVGMSQNGANTMAAQGKNFQEILSFFYEGTDLTQWNTL